MSSELEAAFRGAQPRFRSLHIKHLGQPASFWGNVDTAGRQVCLTCPDIYKIMLNVDRVFMHKLG